MHSVTLQCLTAVHVCERMYRFVLRNYMAQEVIEKAEAGDFSGVRNLLQLLKDPYGLGGSAGRFTANYCYRAKSSDTMGSAVM